MTGYVLKACLALMALGMAWALIAHGGPDEKGPEDDI